MNCLRVFPRTGPRATRIADGGGVPPHGLESVYFVLRRTEYFRSKSSRASRRYTDCGTRVSLLNSFKCFTALGS